MPELPEVHTTVEGLKRVIIGKTIKNVWSDFHVGAKYGNKQNIKNKKYLDKFKKIVKGAKIISVERKGKNILINLNNRHTAIVHMKMTGHLMVGRYEKSSPPYSSSLPKRGAVPPKAGRGEVWLPAQKGPLEDSYNKFIHLVFSLSNKKHLVLSDMRKFASVSVFETNELHLHGTIGKLGPDPFDSRFSAQKLFEIIHVQKSVPIKSALLDQSAISGIGNIYSDEILWQTGIHPLSKSDKIPKTKFPEIFRVMQKILRSSIKHGGDSKSDYRNALGEKGGFQNFHKVYGKKDQKCSKPKCSGIIERMVIRSRSAHFCSKHQIKYESH